jgi:outer membrane biosynthesis protein TonB
MKLPAKIVASLLPLLLSGCFLHKKAKPVQPLAPKIDTTSTAPPPAQSPPPEITIPTKPQVADTKLPVETPQPPPKHKKAPANPAPAPAETQQASSGEPAVSAIGVLSSGDPADVRQQTVASLADTERGLNGLNRQLSDQEKKTASHIREYLKQAKTALASGDVDGASTLAAKAKVLLQELTH